TDYTVTNWLTDQTVSRTLQDLLLGLKRFPYIDENDENIEDKFIQNYYSVYAPANGDIDGKEVEGLAVAFLYNTLAVSLQTDVFWNQIEISLLEKHEDYEKTVLVKHVNDSDHILEHQEWIDSCRPVELPESQLAEADKEISLRDDHGKDVLQTFSNRLIRSPYVEKVINSLPFNPHQRNFIKNISLNGKIEIVLVQTDQGLGCVIQTTGRNLQETKRIAEILEKKYGK
ncbi:MAG: hypothetical protein U9P42_08100, partial [Candidatus Fermentibacteria bacterium]|nr:hypothetical protein [Candidatus Fermentibacteria bacterium]